MNFYEKLAATPLFQGLTNSELTQIIGQTKFAFRKIAPGKTIHEEGEPCHSMAFLIDGVATAIMSAADHGYSVEETMLAPEMLQPERLFGLTQRYTHTFTALTECDLMEIGKNDIMQLSDEFFIFRINLLNAISTVSQKNERLAWQPMPQDTRGRIARFLALHCTKPTGAKTIRIKMTRLAQETGLGRLAISKELNEMQELGLLDFSRGIITIKAIEKLYQKI